jgi:molecular chaperone DnaK
VYNTEKSLSEHKAKLDAATVSNVEAAISKARDASAKEGITVEELKAALTELETASMSIGKAIYSSSKPAEEGKAPEGGPTQEAEQVKPEEKK